MPSCLFPRSIDPAGSREQTQGLKVLLKPEKPETTLLAMAGARTDRSEYRVPNVTYTSKLCVSVMDPATLLNRMSPEA